MNKSIELKSNAKINLFLDIVNKRNDGYHNIKSVMQEIDLCDVVKVSERIDGINISCDNYNIPLDERNTCYRAFMLIKEKFNINSGVNIDIKKVIPTGAGLAGGSANAASVIKGVNELLNLNMSRNEMLDIGSRVGADVAFCLTGGTCLCEGIGDKITELKPFVWDNIIIIKPDFSISTPIAYKNVTEAEYNFYYNCKILEHIENEEYYDTCMSVANTLEIAAIKMKPQIVLVKDDLKNYGAISSLMTGSGSSVYGFYANDKIAASAYKKLSQKYSSVFMTKAFTQ